MELELDSANDEALVMSAQAGDLRAYDELVRRYQGRIWSYLFKFCPHQSELEDLVQETFLRAYKNLHKWRPSGTFKSWLMRIALNTGYDYHRGRKLEPLNLALKERREEDGDEAFERLTSGVAEDSAHPNAEIIERLLLKLKPEDRLLVTLQYYERIPLPEIAEQLQWSLSKTKVRSHRARKLLETLLRKHGIEHV